MNLFKKTKFFSLSKNILNMVRILDLSFHEAEFVSGGINIKSRNPDTTFEVIFNQLNNILQQELRNGCIFIENEKLFEHEKQVGNIIINRINFFGYYYRFSAKIDKTIVRLDLTIPENYDAAITILKNLELCSKEQEDELKLKEIIFDAVEKSNEMVDYFNTIAQSKVSSI